MIITTCLALESYFGGLEVGAFIIDTIDCFDRKGSMLLGNITKEIILFGNLLPDAIAGACKSLFIQSAGELEHSGQWRHHFSSVSSVSALT